MVNADYRIEAIEILLKRAGLGTLEDIADASPEGLIAACQRAIEKDALSVKAPLMKEARTHVTVARAFTDRLEG